MRHGRSDKSGRPVQVQMFWPPRSRKHHRKHDGNISTYYRKAHFRDRYGKYVNGVQQSADIIAGSYSYQEK